MIKGPAGIIAVLIFIEVIVLYVSSRPYLKKYFSFIPPVFWMYFLPMLASTFGLIEPKNPVYQAISLNLLPASLVLLLLSSDIRSILKLEKQALVMMLAGTIGIMIGTPLAFFIVKGMVGPEMWSGFGALSASWVGGSANMIAVKEAIGTPDAVFAPMVIVDTVVPYAWMGLLIAGAAFQGAYDKWNRSDRGVLDTLASSAPVEEKGGRVSRYGHLAVVLAVGLAGALAARLAASAMPPLANIFNLYTWTIITASVIGITLSFTPLGSFEPVGASNIGYFMLYFVLTSIGARAGISNISSAAILIAAGFLIVSVHALVLLAASRVMKAPMFLVAVASQANVGGVASAPIVAAIYQPGLASVGLLLAILGNIIGTYSGIITGYLCRMVAR